MLKRSDIKGMAGNLTYGRGIELYQKRKVLQYHVETDMLDPDLENVIAKVKGSGRSAYTVEIAYDTARDEVESTYCDCPAFESYRGICKHCVAVLLEYMEYQQEQGEGYKASALKSPKYSGGASFSRTDTDDCKMQGRDTTAAFKALMEKEIARRTAPALQPQLQGQIRLLPYLEMSEDADMQVSFKVGNEHLYVLKDIFQFVEHMRRQEEYAYGKKLSFIHTLEAFEEESRGYVAFLMDWVRENKKSYMKSKGYYSFYYDTAPAMRYMALTSSTLERLLEEALGQRIEASIPAASAGNWEVCQGKPALSLTITGQETGVDMHLNCPTVYEGSRYLIFFKQGVIYLHQDEGNAELMELIRSFAASGKTVYVKKEDLPAFCSQLLPKIQRWMTVQCENFEPKDYAAEEALFAFYLDAPVKDVICCQAKAVYGTESYNLLEPSVDVTRRDLVKEADVLREVRPFFESAAERKDCLAIEKDEELTFALLTEGIDYLRQLGDVYVSDALKKINVRPAPKVSVQVSVSGSLLDLSLLCGDMSREDLADILNRYDKKKKYHRLKNGDFINIDDDGIDMLAELKESLHLSAKELLGDKILLPKYRAMYLDQALKEKTSLAFDRDREFRALIRNMRTTEDNDYELPSGICAVLREYQKRGFLWMKTLSGYGFGGILADDMGLGKTLQVITYLQSEWEEKGRGQRPHLIVCPASLVYNWESELERFAPELPVRVIAGSAAERKREISAIENGDVCITSYELLRRDITAYEAQIFGCQVIDEAQYIKNHGTQSSKAVKLIRASFRLALTGTPIENRLSELWSIFDYLMPGFLFGYERFRKELEIPVVQVGDDAVIQRLRKMIQPFVLRRLKADVLRDLPDKIEKNTFIRLTGEQQELYDAEVKKLQLMLTRQSDAEFNTSKIKVLAELTRLRQICCDPGLFLEGYKGSAAKMDLAMELIENAAAGGHKVLLFSQFTSLFPQLMRKLEAAEHTCYMLTGATPKEERTRLVNAFNQDDTQVFLISLKAGGTGLNLTGADVVIHFDPWWNLAVQDQATDRAHRIGQKSVVNVYKLVAKDTIEERILEMQEKKRQLSDQLLSGGDMSGAMLTREELMELLG